MAAARAVLISPIAPARSGNGLAMRMGLFAEALARIARVDVIVVPVAGEAGDPARFAREIGVRTRRVEIEGRFDTHFTLLSRIPDESARLAAFRDYGKPSLSRALSAPVVSDIARAVDACRPDLVHVGRSYLAPGVAWAPSRVAMTLDLDEDDRASFLSQARTARANGRSARAEWLEQEGLACDALIAYHHARFRRLYVASRVEAAALSRRHPGLACETLVNAVEIPRRPTRRDDGATLLFVGALGYAPNAEGLAWFAREVLPRMRAGGRACRLLIAGARPPPTIAALARHPRIEVLGPVAEVAPLYRSATLALAPLRSGGGTRIKLLEAAAHRVASVSTLAAASGIEWPHEVGGWRADSALDFASACSLGLADPEERDRRARQAREWVKNHHARDRAVTRLARSLVTALDGAAINDDEPTT
jgi:glycosyltransferase involved in cell wall biosynthesis